jgi:hypothetical protein
MPGPRDEGSGTTDRRAANVRAGEVLVGASTTALYGPSHRVGATARFGGVSTLLT